MVSLLYNLYRIVTNKISLVNDKTLRFMFESFIPLTPPISDKSRTDQADAMVV